MGAARSVPTRDAATVVLLRDGEHGLEAYVLRRVVGMAFAAGMHVFPGGVVDPRDADADIAWAGPPVGDWGRRLGADEALTRALVCAAVRETFEESGVLLAGPDAGGIVADTSGPDWESDRAALVDRSLAFADLLTRRTLVLRADLLRPWAHWITPVVEPRRYDTRFFVAALPAGQRTREVGGEADHVAWLRPATGVQAERSGRMPMLPPTIVTLRELSAYGTVGEVLAAAAERTIRPILPEVVVDDGQLRVVGPPEALP